MLLGTPFLLALGPLLQVLEAFAHHVYLKLDRIEDPELEMIHLGLAVDHPDDLEGDQQQGQLEGEKPGDRGQGESGEFPDDIEYEQAHDHDQEDDVDHPVLPFGGDASDLTDDLADPVLLASVVLQLLA